MSPQHETENTVATSAWCNTCGRRTLHSVSGKRIGRCQEHAPEGLSKKQERLREQAALQEKNPKLF